MQCYYLLVRMLASSPQVFRNFLPLSFTFLCMINLSANLIQPYNLRVYQMKMKTILCLTFHGSCAVFHMYIIYWLMFAIGLKIVEMVSFFTVWTTVVHLIVFLALAAHDVGRIYNEYVTKHGDIGSTRMDIFVNNEDFLRLFLHLALVMSSYTQCLFWLLFYIDREMILPEAAGIPSSLNHMMHTLPFFFALIAIIVFTKNFPNVKEEKKYRNIAQADVKLVGLVVFAYLAFIWILFEVKGVWPYPFMFSFSRLDYCIFCLCVFLLFFVLCHICSFFKVKIKNLQIL